MAARLAQAFPDDLEVTDDRKSRAHHVSEGLRQKPRPVERAERERHDDASATTPQTARYRVQRSFHIMGRLWVPKVRISSIDFVVKTTWGSNSAPFDVGDDIVRRHATTPSIEGVA